MSSLPLSRTHLPLRSRAFYRRVLAELTKAEVPFLVGGAYAFGYYTGIVRHTKEEHHDLDLGTVRWYLVVHNIQSASYTLQGGSAAQFD